MSSLPLPPVKSSKLSVMVVLSRFVSSFSSLSLSFSPLSFFLRGPLLHLHGGRASAPPRLFSFLFCKPSLSFFPRPRPPLLDQWRSARPPSSPLLPATPQRLSKRRPPVQEKPSASISFAPPSRFCPRVSFFFSPGRGGSFSAGRRRMAPERKKMGELILGVEKFQS